MITINYGFKINAREAVDVRLILTKEEMKACTGQRPKYALPPKYFALCTDDNQLYFYDETNEDDVETGKFRIINPQVQRNAYDNISQLRPFLYEANYTNLDYDYANEWFKNATEDIDFGACSSIRNGKMYGRNYDWKYDNAVDFVIKTPRVNGRFATIGIGGNEPTLTKELVESGRYSDSYKIIPFKLLDGINEYGVFVNTNVVPSEYGSTTGTEPKVKQEMELCNLALPRYILDHFKTAAEAVDYIEDYVSIYSYKPLVENYKEDIHVMIGDKNETYVMEFIHNNIVVEKCERPIMTNFFRYDVNWNEDGSVYTSEEHWNDETKSPMNVNKITSHGCGLERHNLLNNSFDEFTNVDSALEIMNQLIYTRAYTNEENIWYSECVGEFPTIGIDDLTIEGTKDDFELVHRTMKKLYDGRSRDTGKTWQSIHSCVYDLDKQLIYLRAQEELDDLLVLSFDYYTSYQVDELVSPENLSGQIPAALKLALSKQEKPSGLGVDEDGNIEVLLNKEHLDIVDGKIDLVIDLIQAN